MTTERYPESPCVGICQMDGDRRYCMGCGRTLSEIAAWSTMAAGDRRAVLAELPVRMGRGPAHSPREDSA